MFYEERLCAAHFVDWEIQARGKRNNSTFMTACNNAARDRQGFADPLRRRGQAFEKNEKRASARLALVTGL
jgi:hypothetical protein